MEGYLAVSFYGWCEGAASATSKPGEHGHMPDLFDAASRPLGVPHLPEPVLPSMRARMEIEIETDLQVEWVSF